MTKMVNLYALPGVAANAVELLDVLAPLLIDLGMPALAGRVETVSDELGECVDAARYEEAINEKELGQ